VLEKPLLIILPFANLDGTAQTDTANPATTVVTTAVTTMVKRCASSMDSSTKWFFLLGRSLQQMQRVIRHQQMLPMILSSALFTSNHSSWRIPATHLLSTNKLMEKMLSALSIPFPRQLMTSSSWPISEGSHLIELILVSLCCVETTSFSLSSLPPLTLTSFIHNPSLRYSWPSLPWYAIVRFWKAFLRLLCQGMSKPEDILPRAILHRPLW